MTSTTHPLRTWAVTDVDVEDGDSVHVAGHIIGSASDVTFTDPAGYRHTLITTHRTDMARRLARLAWLQAPETRGPTKAEGLRWAEDLRFVLAAAQMTCVDGLFLDDYGPDKYGRTLGDLWWHPPGEPFGTRRSASQVMLAAGCPPYLS